MLLSTPPKKLALLYWQMWQIGLVSFLKDTFSPKSFVKGICTLGNRRTGPKLFSLASVQRGPWKIVLLCGEVVGCLLKRAFFGYDRVDDKPHYLSAHDLRGDERRSFPASTHQISWTSLALLLFMCPPLWPRKWGTEAGQAWAMWNGFLLGKRSLASKEEEGKLSG